MFHKIFQIILSGSNIGTNKSLQFVPNCLLTLLYSSGPMLNSLMVNLFILYIQYVFWAVIWFLIPEPRIFKTWREGGNLQLRLYTISKHVSRDRLWKCHGFLKGGCAWCGYCRFSAVVPLCHRGKHILAKINIFSIIYRFQLGAFMQQQTVKERDINLHILLSKQIFFLIHVTSFYQKSPDVLCHRSYSLK